MAASYGWTLGAAFSAGLHGVAWLVSSVLSVAPSPAQDRAPLLIEMPVEAEPEPAPAPEVEEKRQRAEQPAPPEDVVKPTDKAPATPPPAAKTAARAAPAAPTPAQAGKTLTAEADAPGEVADFTMVQGLADSYAGGTTTALGTSERAVHGVAADGPRAAAASGAPTPKTPPGEEVTDRSRGASPSGGDWSCSHLFPSDPDAPDQAAVTLVVEVDGGGRASSIRVVRDPGFGFGDAARRCAASQRFTPALAPDGAPIAGRTRPFVVRFSR